MVGFNPIEWVRDGICMFRPGAEMCATETAYIAPVTNKLLESFLVALPWILVLVGLLIFRRQIVKIFSIGFKKPIMFVLILLFLFVIINFGFLQSYGSSGYYGLYCTNNLDEDLPTYSSIHMTNKYYVEIYPCCMNVGSVLWEQVGELLGGDRVIYFKVFPALNYPTEIERCQNMGGTPTGFDLLAIDYATCESKYGGQEICINYPLDFPGNEINYYNVVDVEAGTVGDSIVSINNLDSVKKSISSGLGFFGTLKDDIVNIFNWIRGWFN